MPDPALPRLRPLILAAAASTGLPAAAAIDVDALWDFRAPAVSEQRFRDALATASPDDQLILQTQIARTHGLRRDFAKARELLGTLADQQAQAGAEARVRWQLEMGRTFASATHDKTSRTAEALAAARRHFLAAFDTAQQARLDALAIDALHMMTFVDTEPAQQLAWNERALAVLEQSDQPAARKWEASLRHNTGYALHQAGQYEAALRQFRLSRAAHASAGRTRNVRITDWMMAWTLRAQGRLQDALALQLQLEAAWDADGQPDPYVYEELELIHRALGQASQAEGYAAKRAALRQ